MAVDAFRKAKLTFPERTITAKLAWRHVQSPDFETASVPGAPTTLQIIIENSRRYSSSGGWGLGRFVTGKPVDLAQHRACFACHEARVKARDYVFNRYAP